jgi:hypothetical protein
MRPTQRTREYSRHRVEWHELGPRLAREFARLQVDLDLGLVPNPPPWLAELLAAGSPFPVGLVIRNLVRQGIPHPRAVQLALAIRDRRNGVVTSEDEDGACNEEQPS